MRKTRTRTGPLFLFIFLSNIVLIHMCDDPRHAMTPVAGSRTKGKVELDLITHSFFPCVLQVILIEFISSLSYIKTLLFLLYKT